MPAVLLVSLTAAAATAWPAALDQAGRVSAIPATITRPDDAPWLVQHAADELARYLHLITGAEVTVAAAPQQRDGIAFALSVGPGAQRLRFLRGGDDPRRARDGFIIRSAGPGQVRIAALEPIGLLYGVYHYLGACCGVGFFWDGDYVPRLDELPTQGLDIAEIPRWPVRHFGLASGFALAKWHHQFRSTDERERIFDWMAKRRLNRTSHYFGPTIAHSGLSAKRVFGISDDEPDNFTFAGWPGCLDFPADVRTDIIRHQLDHSRRRGIEWIYYLAFGNVPHQFRERYPEYNYVGHLGYSATVLYPDDPACQAWTKAFYRDIIRTYGTDHIYQDTPFVESSGAADPEQSMQLKLAAARQMCEVFRDLDPLAVWESDSWDFGAVPQVWTPERIETYFASLPRDMMFVYDTAGLANPFYKRTDYFRGTSWAFGILHSFQGDDHLHGDLAHAISAIQELSGDPRADKCEGIYHVPEISGHNVLFFDLTTRLAWQPEGVALDDYLADYARRRYGERDRVPMLRAVEALVRAVYRGGGQMPIYQKLGCGYGPWWWPIVDKHRQDSDPRPAIAEASRDLAEALRLALECREGQAGNALYENDLVDWARTYLAHVFNWAVLDAYAALGAGDAARVSSSSALARECMAHIEAILSTRRDFWLQPQIEAAMAVPGANPHLPWYIKQHCINDLYAANEVYEQLHWYYRPRMAVYLDELAARAEAGERAIVWSDIEAPCAAIQERWLTEDIAVPAEERFDGAPLQAVERAMAAIGPPGA